MWMKSVQVACLVTLSPCHPVTPSARAADGTACHGTAVEFVDTPKEAAALAKQQEKLVFVLHISGHFDDPRFT